MGGWSRFSHRSAVPASTLLLPRSYWAKLHTKTFYSKSKVVPGDAAGVDENSKSFGSHSTCGMCHQPVIRVSQTYMFPISRL